MKIKRFFAADIRQAMRMVKDELGSDAVIMSNKSVDGGVEIVAARDFDEQMLQKNLIQEAEAAPARSKAKKVSDDVGYSVEKERLHVISSARKPDGKEGKGLKNVRREVDKYLGYAEKAFLAKPDEKNQVAPVKADVKKPTPAAAQIKEVDFTEFKLNSSRFQGQPELPRQITVAEPKPEPALAKNAGNDDLLAEIRKEFKQLQFSMAARMAEANWASTLQNNPVRLDLLHRLADMGISKKLSIKVANRLGSHATSDFAFEKAQEMLAKVLPISEHNIVEQGGVIALVGPTGVGKTTTIAKIAAKFILKHGPRQVALITTDNYRIAAHEQLNTYGRILDVPVRSASNAEELRSLINDFFDKKLILIDTAGMGPRDMRLAEQLLTLQKHDIPVKSYLVMSATTQYKAMQAIVKAFQAIDPKACIITKLDEAESKGAVISVLIEQQLPLAFITDGQQVPEDIHIPRAQRLVEQCVAELDSGHDYSSVVGYEDWVTKGYA